jgi:hypothetical protein
MDHAFSSSGEKELGVVSVKIIPNKGWHFQPFLSDRKSDVIKDSSPIMVQGPAQSGVDMWFLL